MCVYVCVRVCMCVYVCACVYARHVCVNMKTLYTLAAICFLKEFTETVLTHSLFAFVFLFRELPLFPSFHLKPFSTCLYC